MYLKKPLMFLLAVIFSVSVFSENTKVENIKKAVAAEKPYVLDCHPFLREIDDNLTGILKNDPDIFQRTGLQKTSSWNFSVGSAKTWWSVNLDTDEFYSVSSTCRAVGSHCYIFVQNDKWGSDVTQSVVDNVKNAFDSSTPANASKGIYETVTGIFGSTPDIDSDSKIIILIMDIQDGYVEGSNSGYVAGYFSSVNEYPQSALSGTDYKSNEAEIFYMDCNPADLISADGLLDVLNTTAHEFQHMIHWNYHRTVSQVTFFNEGCSEISPYICGYGLRSHTQFTDNTDISLTNWSSGSDDVLIDYARASRYFLYMYEQFGSEFLTKFVQDNLVGASAVNSALANLSTSTSRRYNDIFVDWCIANAVNDNSVNSKWGYDAENLSTAEGDLIWDLNTSNTSLTTKSFASSYITFPTGSNLSFTVSSSNSDIVFKEIKFGATVEVSDIQSGTTYNETDFGTAYSRLTIVAINNTYQDINFTYNSTGNTTSVNELSYDSEYDANNALALSAGARQGVLFEGVDGAKLNSVKIMFRKTSSMNCRVYKFNTSTSPVGASLTNSFTLAAANDKDWAEQDFSSSDIDLSNDFFVVVDIPENITAEAGNCVIVTKKPSESFEYSLFYDPDNVKWIYYTDGSGNVYLNRIRVTFSVNVNGVEKIIDAVPIAYNLEQNYPNPFNPSTIIRYQLPVNSRVNLTIYNLLGQEISTPVNELQAAGNFEVRFDASGLAGGIYLYTLQTGEGNRITKKMVLLK